MKDIIKQVLNENIDPRDRIEKFEYIESRDLKLWREEGLLPYIFIDDGKDGVEFKEITLKDITPQNRRNFGNILVYLLTDVQAKYAQKFAEPIIQKIILTRKSIQLEKQLFTGVLVHKFMKNAFGKMTIDDKPESNEPTA
jgi:hypothetical protein